MIPIYAFLDLDDSLFQSQAKSPPGELFPIAYDRQGQALSYMTPAQRTFWQFLSQATVIPTTGRSWNACRRVHLPFMSGAVICHGAVIMTPAGQPDPTYAALVAPDLAAAQPLLAQVADDISPDFEVYRLNEFGLSCGVSVKHPQRDALATEGLARTLRERYLGHNLTIWAHGGHLAVLPPGVSKARAVGWLVEQLRAKHGAILTLGLGDAPSDREFLALCDFAILPRSSTNFKLLREVP